MSQSGNRRHLITLANPRSPISEAYRTLRTNIDFSAIDSAIQVIVVTSAGPGEGKSTTISNLAITFAQSERRVVLIDADMRKPTAHHTFRASNRVGLSSLLAHKNQLEDVLQETNVPDLFIITAGPIPPNPAEMLASRRMSELLELLKTEFDIILIDTPPLLAVTDAQLIASKSDGVVLVMEYGSVKREAALKAKAGLDTVNAKILGVVMNNVKRSKSEQSYYYYYGSNEE
ncbi:CpsD/CapB family tyrosine-protein kinase [Paenibacillus sp. PR3]|uniref:non-specific protein-tyrosine kinase n=1 Tax=Paenibacillus terricola TaxID=2763503 RepID=A0ABR8MXS6_9BACL|nr:CpsD/CapB family tyrosine-protein kinase [Paenibacillus terricola]MBD3920688.1 CpsD/CapB family tyrosine-protein kinase [Paenibacillus terricola]